MSRSTAAGLLLALGLLFAAPAFADTYRLPKSGDIAFVVDAPDSLTGQYDEYGNLQFMSPDRSFAVQYSMIVDAQVASTSLSDVAAMIFKSAGAQAATTSEPGQIAGRVGQTFTSALPLNGVALTMRVTLIKLDATHIAALATLTRPEITPAQTAAMNALIARGTLSGL